MLVVSTSPFYLNTSQGSLFCIYYSPESEYITHNILYIHPFGDEMNKSRKQAALQAHAFAAMGAAVLIIDLFGCGDSEGDFRDADWEIWKQNIISGIKWLKEKNGMPIYGDCV